MVYVLQLKMMEIQKFGLGDEVKSKRANERVTCDRMKTLT